MSKNRIKILTRRVFNDRKKASSGLFGKEILDIEKWPQKWQDKVRNARMIAGYMPLSDELSLDAFWRSIPAGKCFPRVEGEEIVFYEAFGEGSFESGSFSILEPKKGMSRVEIAKIDVVLVPATAYDRDGTRLGRGKGFYDRCFSEGRNGKKPLLIGVVPSENLLSRLPRDPWDLRVSAIVTEQEFLEVSL